MLNRIQYSGHFRPIKNFVLKCEIPRMKARESKLKGGFAQFSSGSFANQISQGNTQNTSIRVTDSRKETAVIQFKPASLLRIVTTFLPHT